MSYCTGWFTNGDMNTKRITRTVRGRPRPFKVNVSQKKELIHQFLMRKKEETVEGFSVPMSRILKSV